MQIKEKKSGKMNKKSTRVSMSDMPRNSATSKRSNSHFDFLDTRRNIAKSKCSQVTIFIIIAIVIIAVLAVLLIPRINIIAAPSEDANKYIGACAEKAVNDIKKTISLQGGGIEPENYVMYQGNKVEYLCYTNKYYQKCAMQRPLLKNYFEDSIASYAKTKVEGCIDKYKADMEKRGYSVETSDVNVGAEIAPKKIDVLISSPLTLTKESSKTFSSFSASVDSEIYDLIMISSSILNWEARYGDSDPVAYMAYYPDLKVEKMKNSDGTTIYTLTQRETKEKLMFASRSIAWPAGYGIKEVLL